MWHSLFASLTDDSLIITANQRLGRHLQEAYGEICAKQQVWVSPPIMALASWLEECYSTYFDLGLINQSLLSENQSLLLWEQIVSTSTLPLLHPRGTAKTAWEAWQLLQQWQLSLTWEHFQYQGDCQQFFTWAQLYESQLHELACLDKATFVKELIRVVAQKIKLFPRHLIFVGFEKLTPLQNLFLEKLIQHHCLKIHFFSENACPTAAMTIELANTKEEIATMARWAAAQLESDPTLKIGCIIPNLMSQRNLIQRTFNNYLPNQFNLSGGTQLSQQPLMATALLWLKWLALPLKLTEISYLLRSPFAPGSAEYSQEYSLFLAWLGEGSRSEFSLKQLHEELINFDLESSLFSQCLEQLLNLTLPKQASPLQWRDYFQEVLQLAQWPGARQLSSREYQLLTQSLQFISEFAGLSRVWPSSNYLEAWQHLQQLANEQLFQEKTSAKPVQILGILEAAGHHFDCLWVMDLQATHWPAAPRPNPFIPWNYYRDYDLAHGTSDRELQFHCWLTKLFATSAPTVVFSYPCQSAEEILLPSPLLAPFPIIKVEDLGLVANTAIAKEPIPITQLADFHGLPLQTSTKVKGGTSLFKLQANCPFQATAALRLQATAIATPEPGLAYWQRGSLLHRLLELFWKKVKSHKKLVAMELPQRQQLVEECATQVIEELSQQHSSLEQVFLNLEKLRLARLCDEWLALEAQRQPFTVKEIEQSQMIQYGPLQIKVKVDRVDELQDGSQLVIDYKTGQVSPNAWFGDRPDEPQLPLYCITYGNKVEGLAFAQIRPFAVAFKGYSKGEQDCPGITVLDSWTEQLALWQQTMSELAEQFAAGWAVVDPKQSNSCQYCEFHGLCRIGETTE